ncbi:MAG: DUF6804 family protein [Candidatus Paceibacterota bacterium]
MNDGIKIKNILTVLCIIALLLAIPSIWPYGYYQLLRWLIAGIAVFIAYIASELEKRIWVWIMAIIAILFNPIVPIHLVKETWVVIDFIVAIMFMISLFKIKKK